MGGYRPLAAIRPLDANDSIAAADIPTGTEKNDDREIAYAIDCPS